MNRWEDFKAGFNAVFPFSGVWHKRWDIAGNLTAALLGILSIVAALVAAVFVVSLFFELFS